MYVLSILTAADRQLCFAGPRKSLMDAFRADFEATYGLTAWRLRDATGILESGPGDQFSHIMWANLPATLVWHHENEKRRR